MFRFSCYSCSFAVRREMLIHLIPLLYTMFNTLKSNLPCNSMFAWIHCSIFQHNVGSFLFVPFTDDKLLLPVQTVGTVQCFYKVHNCFCHPELFEWFSSSGGNITAKIVEKSTGLFKMVVGVQLSSGNSAPNSGNNHRLTIPFEGGMLSFKRRGACVSRNWRYKSEPPLKP